MPDKAPLCENVEHNRCDCLTAEIPLRDFCKTCFDAWLDRMPVIEGVDAAFRLQGAKNLGRGYIAMGFIDCRARIIETDTDEEIGYVEGNMGGSVTVSDKERNETWTISPTDLWRLYQALRASYERKPVPKEKSA